jgi:hypothetical protein
LKRGRAGKGPLAEILRREERRKNTQDPTSSSNYPISGGLAVMRRAQASRLGIPCWIRKSGYSGFSSSSAHRVQFLHLQMRCMVRSVALPIPDRQDTKTLVSCQASDMGVDLMRGRRLKSVFTVWDGAESRQECPLGSRI